MGADNDILKENKYYQILPEELLSNQGTTINKYTAFSSDLIGILFTASWPCNCTVFNAVVSHFYLKVNSQTENRSKKIIEIIYNSGDKDIKSFNEFFKDKPFLAIPYESDSRMKMSELCEINTIPCLIVIDKYGNIIDEHGERTIRSYNEEAVQIWLKELNNIKEKNRKDKNDENN